MIDREIKSQLESLRVLHTIIETYEEIAASRMRKIKNSVLKNRLFLSELNIIFNDIETTIESKKSKAYKKNIKDKKSRYIYDKDVSILLSANSGLYGRVIRDTISLFVEDMSKKNSDMIVIGKVGKNIVDKSSLHKEYKYFEFSDDVFSEDQLVTLLREVVKYRNVYVYHGMFRDMLNQEPVVSDILKQVEVQDPRKNQDPATDTSQKEIRSYIFEPSFEEVVNFFERELIGSIFEQYVYESSLSKYASRMINLDFAIVNINQNIKSTNFLRLKLKHRKINSKQQNLMSGLALWSN